MAIFSLPWDETLPAGREGARAFFARVDILASLHGVKTSTAIALMGQESLALDDGDAPRGRVLTAEALPYALEGNDPHIIAHVRCGLAWATFASGTPLLAAGYYTRALHAFASLEDAAGSLAVALGGVAALIGEDDPLMAGRLWGAARIHVGLTARQIPGGYYAQWVSAARQRVGEAEWRTAERAGRALSMEDAVLEALDALDRY